MQCVIHSQVAAFGVCTYCGKPFCHECLVELNGRMYCKNDVANIVNQTQSPQPSNAPAIHITNANTSQNTNMNMNQFGFGIAIPPKSKVAALLLCFFLGVFGGHRFYVGKTGTAILYLCTGGICGIGAIVDFIIIAVGGFRDAFGRPLI